MVGQVLQTQVLEEIEKEKQGGKSRNDNVAAPGSSLSGRYVTVCDRSQPMCEGKLAQPMCVRVFTLLKLQSVFSLQSVSQLHGRKSKLSRADGAGARLFALPEPGAAGTCQAPTLGGGGEETPGARFPASDRDGREAAGFGLGLGILDE